MQLFSWRSPLVQALDFLNKLFLPGVLYGYTKTVNMYAMGILDIKIRKSVLKNSPFVLLVEWSVFSSDTQTISSILRSTLMYCRYFYSYFYFLYTLDPLYS